MRRYWLQLPGIAGSVLVADQASKALVAGSMAPGQSFAPVPALEQVFRITYSQNRGAAFGLLPAAADVFLVAALVFVAALLWQYPRLAASGRLTRIGCGLLCGGALGNAADRLQHGLVIDFIHYQIPGVISNVSNLADHAIVLGALLLLLESRWPARGKKRTVAADGGAERA